MVCFKRCCCCVNLRVGGMMMGVMTLALSVFSIIPMAISLANRIHMSRVITHMVEEYSYSGTKQDEMNSVAFWGTVSDAFKNDQSNLPPEDNEKVVWLAFVSDRVKIIAHRTRISPLFPFFFRPCSSSSSRV